MNARLVHRIIQLLLAALLLTGILLLAGGTAAAQNRVQRRAIVVRPIRPFRPFRSLERFDSPYDRFNRDGCYSQYVFSNSH
jgi:hypothetical protein